MNLRTCPRFVMLSKNDLAEILVARIGLSKIEAAEALEDILELIKTELVRGQDVKITNFGTFQTREKGARKGRNPISGNEITISARRVVTFKPSHTLREGLNGE